MPQNTESKNESPAETPLWRKRLTTAGKVGRLLCVVFVVLVCANTVRGVFRLLDAFGEKEPDPTAVVRQSDEPPPIPLLAFDSEGRWNMAGLSETETAPLMPMPETTSQIGSRNDRNGNPQMQFYEFAPDKSAAESERDLLDDWSQRGWKCRTMKIPSLVSYWCERGDSRRFIQFFSDSDRHYVLICLAPAETGG